jgi:RRXRR protein
MQIRVKSKTSLGKVRSDSGRLKPTEPSAGGTAQNIPSASQARIPFDGQQRRDCIYPAGGGLSHCFGAEQNTRTGLPPNPVIVPVLASDGEPLMPASASRARRWAKQHRATPFWLNGVWCVRLHFEPTGREKQKVIVGIDPGSKREAFTVASKTHTCLNVLADAVAGVKEAIETRRNLRRSRRNRKTPCRANRKNRAKSPEAAAPEFSPAFRTAGQRAEDQGRVGATHPRGARRITLVGDLALA